MYVCIHACMYVCMYVNYVCILYSSIDAGRSFMQLPWKPQLMVTVVYYLCVREMEVYLLAAPAIW
jgi:hypothetical protein